MRWICEDHIEECLTEEWRKTAGDALKALENASTITAKKAILKKASSSKIWRDFYKLLPENLKKKCWYCEAADVRSDFPIDHFRPKNRLDGDELHDGYWWLAFDWKNYRCACTFCNSHRKFTDTKGGKACQFPLVEEDKRAYKPGDDFNLEDPAFLDPFNPEDCKSIWFDNDGKPAPSENINTVQRKKVENSIVIFHLHETRICRKRNNIRIDVNKKIVSLKAAKEIGDRTQITKITKSLAKMVRETEEYSRAASVYLKPYRSLPEISAILNID
ncbi:HNH endonuclease family protein [Undibacterium umbellatum]|uniref:TIGR02646 family protein n=1 Tax=Undibacterium umbellatum TaxID=2762300 RepID=A0ABR6Z8X2_9BURK|nr:hypothetical protein [Undibacterium umbellatum]MBC3908227.1 hypothetical protein [Undibacterium umbellatum]